VLLGLADDAEPRRGREPDLFRVDGEELLELGDDLLVIGPGELGHSGGPDGGVLRLVRRVKLLERLDRVVLEDQSERQEGGRQFISPT
jgi:hypothetical protein